MSGEEKPRKSRRDKPWEMPKWFDETPPPWEQAWSEDDTPTGYQLAQEKAKEAAG